MINDPLLNKPSSHDAWAPPAPSDVAGSPRPRTSPTHARTRRRRPATSARILAVGLSTSAMFVLTAGYATAAKKNEVPQPTTGGLGTAPTTNGEQASSQNQQSAQQQAAPQQAVPQQSTPQEAAPQQTAPQQAAPQNVVQVPVQPVAPANPGSGGGNNQPSSGSN